MLKKCAFAEAVRKEMAQYLFAMVSVLGDQKEIDEKDGLSGICR